MKTEKEPTRKCDKCTDFEISPGGCIETCHAVRIDPVQAILLSRDQIMTIQMALSFQNQQLQKIHRQAIEAGVDYTEVDAILKHCRKLVDLNNHLQEQL